MEDNIMEEIVDDRNIDISSPSPNCMSVLEDDDHEFEDNYEPRLGMEFDTKDDAYNFYVSYAGRAGFNCRKFHSKKNKKEVVTRVSYSCSNQGFRATKNKIGNKVFQRPTSRVGCMAKIICGLQKNGKFKIVTCNLEHNHELISTPMKHMLKINRNISKAQKSHIDNADKAGISLKSTMDLLSMEIGGREHVGFLDRDCRNYIHRKRKIAMEKGDAGAILSYFEKMKTQDSSYFSSIQLDEDDMITNMFWADARSISDYGLFGDVLCFDTTYQTNEYGRPFAPFVGVNHHKQTIIFGAALLYDETIESFHWLFNTFLKAMSGKQPRTVLTDQSAAMAKAISMVFPETKHRLCVWHIYQNAAKNLSSVFHGSKEFSEDFNKCVYDYEDEEEWLQEWNKMIECYGLQENSWLKSQFALREKWAMVYGRHTFTADMKSTQRSESMNNVLKKYLKPSLDLLRFFEHFERVLTDRRYQELLADFKMMHTTPIKLVCAEMLRHAVEVYTPEVFELFQCEYMRILDYNCYKISKDESISSYKVCYLGKIKDHHVTYEHATQKVTCSCMKFTFVGILCVHALKVLDKKNVKRIPSLHIENRWTRNAKARSYISYKEPRIDDNPKELMGKRYSHLCRNFREIATCASEHDNLFVHANNCLVELLEKLEEMKKTPFLEDDKNGQCVENMVEATQDVDMVVPNGVKKKATVGPPRGRFKDPLEKRRTKCKMVKTTRNKATRQEDFVRIGGTVQESQIHITEISSMVDFTKEPYHVELTSSFASNTQVSNENENDATTLSYQNNVFFTELLQSSMPFSNPLSEVTKKN